MSIRNKKLANIFVEMSTIYEFLGIENRFRVMAYRKASYELENMTEDISEHLPVKNLVKLRGIGISIAQKIEEFLDTGKIETYEQLKKKVPHDFIDLLKIKGLGPETLKRLHRELNINTKSELLKALKDGRVEGLEGFKQKKVTNILNGLQQQEELDGRIVLWEAWELADLVLDHMNKLSEVKKIAVAGSIRRCQETIGDLDLLIMAAEKHRKKILQHFLEWTPVIQVIARGSKKASVIIENYHRQVDLRIFRPKEWGSGLLYFTGNKEHNIHLRKVAIEEGWKINEYGVFDVESGERLAGSTEHEIYQALGMQWIPPEMRVDRGEISLAEQNKIPELVTLSDIKGDLQLHSTWSDGDQSIEELGYFVQENYPYEYIVLTDHSKTSRIAGGLHEEQFLAQIDQIKRVNQKLGADFIKTGAEVDILADGSLDLHDDLLAQLDWVVASIHSQFNRDNTQRLIAACRHPFVSVIGHPTGRLIGKRNPYRLDIDQVIEAAVATGTALEINAQPLRMDLNDQLAHIARKKGAKLVISTDSHYPGNFDFMKLGVALARRAWCTKDNILNTGSWEDISKFKNAKRSKLLAQFQSDKDHES